MTSMPDDIRSYHAALDAEAAPICARLHELIVGGLPDAEAKVWHRHPVWFFDGNPVVGYDRLKSSVRLLFWSGRAFDEPRLAPEGSFQAAEARFTSAEQIDAEDVARWLRKARELQWNYRDIRRNQGLLPLRGVPGA
ncbi:DUF1801 domain-containing protein [Leucobacter allii]|uniref:DUF1801 domain-containing protein n=1 Tax=Leucobacter allii TaxID=2932247 RepID=A0ABY4FJA1_9MICO|nr:DUF1801 domain-containing protein [Leucobacter allii]UOQ55997.1 DUF1801 domain-containing protein [Leucobacter allii]